MTTDTTKYKAIPYPNFNKVKAVKALHVFVETFESEGRPDLADFNHAYELACEALGVEAKEIG